MTDGWALIHLGVHLKRFGLRYLLAVLGSRGDGELLGDAGIAAGGRSDGHVLIGRTGGRGGGKGQRNRGQRVSSANTHPLKGEPPKGLFQVLLSDFRRTTQSVC